jgi:hypothetical protein
MKPTDPLPQAPLPQPLPPPPRAVRRRPGRGWLLGRVPLVVRLLGLAGVGLLLAALWLLGSSSVVALFGTTVPGKVTGLVPAPPGGASAPRVQFAYHVGIQEYAAEEPVDERAFAKLYEGAPVKVKVLRPWPGQPRLVEPPRPSERHPVALLGLAVVWNAAAAAMLWRHLRKPLAQRRLVREGLATPGSVVAKDGDGRPPWLVQFCYQAPTRGLTREAAAGGADGAAVAMKEWQVIMQVGRKEFEAAQVGAAVTVLYDPRKPSHSLVYPFAEYEAVEEKP